MSKNEIGDEKINIVSLTKKLRVNDLVKFDAYLKDIWVDLYSRVTTNKNDPKEKSVKLNGLSKVIFNSYYNLPGIIGDRLFKVFDTNSNDCIELVEFVEGMRTLFYEDYEKNSHFIFDFYDFDNDGKISQEDIRVVLSYITLTYMDTSNLEKKIVHNINLSYKNRVTSQEELCDILNKCFSDSHIKSTKINYKQFKYIIENINSDIYLMIFLFLLERKPFTNKNIESYEHHSRNNSIKSNHSCKKKRRLLASPTKTANFSPYRRFHRQNFSINLEKQNNVVLHTEIGGIQNNICMSPVINRKKILKQNSINIKGQGLINLRPLEDEEKVTISRFKNNSSKNKNQDKNKDNTSDNDNENENDNDNVINLERVNELTARKKREYENIRDSDSPLKVAFKQTKHFGVKPIKGENDSDNETDNNNIKFVDNDEEEDDENDKNSSNNSSFAHDEEKENEGLNYQGKLFKYANDKMKELWFKLIYKDFYYYKNKNEKVHRGMHHLSGLFLRPEGIKEIKGKKYYSFTIISSSKNRVYYCDNETDYNNWISVLKKATGYTNLLDIYDIKQKLGKGKFGLVKLGINKETKQKVAVKIMNKNNMDSSDLELVRTEIEILKICQHPYIIKLYDIFENVDYIYIIMEHCSGGDLFSYLKQRGFQLKENKVVIIIYKLCKALYYVHSYGIAHRDIKPENILLTGEDENTDIRLMDFGLSKIVGPNQKCTEPYGTLTYCAPEIIVDKPYLKTVDSWSLGVMTYLMLSGSLPFTGKNEKEIAKSVVYNKVDFNKKPIWKEISKEAKDFINKLLEKDLKKRIDMKNALEHSWFKKFGLKSNVDNNDMSNIEMKNLKKNSSIKNDFGLYTGAMKK